MKPIKKPELRSLRKTADTQPPPQPPLFVDAVSDEPAIVDPLPLQEQTPAPEYSPYSAPAPDYPLTGSVGNSGWQVSEIWRDLRVDGFCD